MAARKVFLEHWDGDGRLLTCEYEWLENQEPTLGYKLSLYAQDPTQKLVLTLEEIWPEEDGLLVTIVVSVEENSIVDLVNFGFIEDIPGR